MRRMIRQRSFRCVSSRWRLVRRCAAETEVRRRRDAHQGHADQGPVRVAGEVRRQDRSRRRRRDGGLHRDGLLAGDWRRRQSRSGRALPGRPRRQDRVSDLAEGQKASAEGVFVKIGAGDHEAKEAAGEHAAQPAEGGGLRQPISVPGHRRRRALVARAVDRQSLSYRRRRVCRRS